MTWRLWVIVLAAAALFGLAGIHSLATAAEDGPAHRSPYRIVDVHGHGALPALAALQAQLEVMDATGVDTFTLLLFDPAGWPAFQGGWSETNLRAWLELRRQFPERLNVFGTVDFGRVAREPAFFREIVTELAEAARWGMQGIKIWKNLGMHHRDASGELMRIDDPRLDPFWAKCGELGLPVIIHTADPREYWYPNTFNTFQYRDRSAGLYHGHAEVPAWEELIRQRDQVLQKHPRTTFIGAHFGSLTSDLDEVAARLERFPNLFVECGARLRFFYRYHPQALRDFFIKYQDRVLFGSDIFMPGDETTLASDAARAAWRERRVQSYRSYLAYFETDHYVTVPGGYQQQWLRLKGLKLPPVVLEKFYHRNAERIIPARPIATP